MAISSRDMSFKHAKRAKRARRRRAYARSSATTTGLRARTAKPSLSKSVTNRGMDAVGQRLQIRLRLTGQAVMDNHDITFEARVLLQERADGGQCARHETLRRRGWRSRHGRNPANPAPPRPARADSWPRLHDLIAEMREQVPLGSEHPVERCNLAGFQSGELARVHVGRHFIVLPDA